jgi:hypothetical protein
VAWIHLAQGRDKWQDLANIFCVCNYWLLKDSDPQSSPVSLLVRSNDRIDFTLTQLGKCS